MYVSASRPMTELTRKRKALFTLVVFGVAGLVPLLAAEVYVRRTSPYGYVTPETLRSMTPDYEPAVFARHVIRQGARRVVVNGEERFRINSLGYRGRDFTVEKPAGVTRIAFYGGSSVFDVDAPGEGDWPHRVERRLKADGFSNVEVINAGIPGYTTAEAVGTLFSEGHRFSPDYVLLYAQWNDIKLLRSSKSLLRELAPDAVREDPRTTYQNALDHFLSNDSQLYVRLRERYYAWKLRVGEEGAVPSGEYDDTLSDAALKQYQLNLETFVDVARDIGAVPILMIEARLVARENTSEERSRIRYEYVLLSHEGLCRAFEKEDEIIHDVGRRKGVVVIESAQQLTGKGELFASHVHLNERGSEELSRVVASELGRILREGRTR
jgi:lysophospholipase L1-like esterase